MKRFVEINENVFKLTEGFDTEVNPNDSISIEIKMSELTPETIRVMQRIMEIELTASDSKHYNMKFIDWLNNYFTRNDGLKRGVIDILNKFVFGTYKVSVAGEKDKNDDDERSGKRDDRNFGS